MTSRPWRLLAMACALSACSSAESPAPTAPTRSVCRVVTPACARRVEVSPGRFVRSYQTVPLAVTDSLVTQAVVVVHGTDRNADEYFAAMVDAADRAGRLGTTLIIAPRFITTDDGPAADEPVWSSSGWREGDLSSSTGPLPRISSYAVIDTIVATLQVRSRFPRLTRIVVAGHSAGAQLVHRYAATTRTATGANGIAVQFVAANPSSWLYLTAARPTGTTFGVPADAAVCPTYDDWHYGLQNRNTYANAVSATTMQQQLTTRALTVLLGTADTLTADLDVSCGGTVQGARRYSRGLSLMAYMNATFPGHAHRLVTVPGVGHSSTGMFTSLEARPVLFP